MGFSEAVDFAANRDQWLVLSVHLLWCRQQFFGNGNIKVKKKLGGWGFLAGEGGSRNFNFCLW